MMSLAEIGVATKAIEVFGHAQLNGVTTDSRKNCASKLFVALNGPNFDGHDYIEAAVKAEASAVMVHRAYTGSLPAVRVSDTSEALLELGRAWREKYPVSTVGVTGSAGKTTVKEMLGTILSLTGQGVVTKGNLNNHIGVPLTLTRLGAGDQYAVIEMGMSNRGEISRLSKITRPNVAIITNAGAAHLEGLGSVDEVAKAKAEIFEGLQEDGVAVINADDSFADYWKKVAGSNRQVTFGFSAESDICVKLLEELAAGQKLSVELENRELCIRLPLSGSHNALNAAAAIAAARAVNVSFELIVEGLESLKPIVGRSNVLQTNGITLIDDAYNANPLSMNAAVDMLVAQKGVRHIVALGDMAELGRGEVEAHAALGRYIALQPISAVYAVGKLMEATVAAIGERASHFSNKRIMLECLRRELKAGDVVLVKGSRSAGMEEIVDGLMVESVQAH
jgi:UDP-N-acetylmuramoyl-tripeptide--D-alanyl-D-alanine ligase